MKLKISKGDFAKALLAVSKSLPARANLPILTNIMLVASDGKLEVTSTNLETATRVKDSVTCEKGGEVTLPGKALLEFVSQLPEGELILEKLGEEMVVSTLGYSARFATMDTSDFPAIPKIEKGQEVQIALADLARAVLRVAFCASTDEGRPVLSGVLCEVGKNSISMVATDGYRLGFQSVPIFIKGNMGDEGFLKIIVPAKSLMEVAKIIGEREEVKKEEKVSVLISENLNQVNFKIDNIEFTSRLIEGEFPNWQKIIPSSFASKAKILREDFIKLVRVAAIFARDSGNIVRLKFEQKDKKDGMMTIFANNSQVGSNEAQTTIELSGKGGDIAFNWRYLLEMLTSIDGENVDFEMIESLNPGKLTVDGESDYFHIIMPVRLQS